MLLIIIGVIYFIFLVSLAKKIKSNKKIRNSFYWKFIVINGIFFIEGLFYINLITIDNYNSFIKYIIYDLIFSYVITIELPVYYLLMNFDNEILEILMLLRTNIIKLKYDYNNITKVKKIINENKEKISDLTILKLIEGFIEVCERLKNIDTTLLNLNIEELNYQINIIERREKHPFPQLIKLVSLAGVSFILAELFSLF